jgi:hypothetical protein|tara:strand:+ start:342 stop:1400 length:1059 start_codon:yes stop_codon:yes gene_type:complete
MVVFLALNIDSMKIIESFTGFQPLEEVWIGGTYPAKFYQHLPNKVEDTFCKITEQTEIGFTNLEKVLIGLGVKVRKPEFGSIDNYFDSFNNLIKPPVAPRDWCITLGNQLWIVPQGYKIEPYHNVIEEYKKQGEHVEILDRGLDPRCWLIFSGIVRLGKKLIVDVKDFLPEDGMKHVKKAITFFEKDYNVILTTEGGHMDGVFCPIKNGHIFSSHWADKDYYDKTVPDWKVFWIEQDRKAREREVANAIKNGRWWTAENNFYSPIFSKHIEEKAKSWVGNSLETVFEANMLVVDEHNVICIAEHEQSFKQMEQLGITPHVVDFPPRHFWDGGIHCITVDIRRIGGCLEYFNE